MYKVIKSFTDLQDNNHAYREGDAFPRNGLIVSKARLSELASNKNKQGKPLIEEIPEEVKAEPKKTVQKKATAKKK